MIRKKRLSPSGNTIEEYQKEYGKQWLKVWQADKRRKPSIKYRGYKDKPRAKWNDWDYYRYEVDTLTEENKHTIPGIHKRGFNTYHIDHKISKRYGYDNGILPEHIAHPSNLHMLAKRSNLKKGTDNIIDPLNEWILNPEL